jgi:N-acyl-L-homoserine lactone synthetase
MVYLITPNDYASHRADLDAMYRLRHKVFFEKLKWQVKSQDNMEKDEYDENNTFYLIYKDQNNIVRGCHRYIPMNHSCMFDGPFDFVLPNLKDYKNAKYWEASRLAVDYDFSQEYTTKDAKNICSRIFAASVLLGLDAEIEGFVTLSYPSVARILPQFFLTSLLASATINNEEVHVTQYSPTNESYAKLLSRINLPKNEPVYILPS